MSWPRTDISANRYINTYFKGFVDISGGGLKLNNGNVIDIDDVTIGSKDGNTSYPIIFFENLDVSGVNAGNGNFLIAQNGETTINSHVDINNSLDVNDISCNGNINAAGTVTSNSDARLKDNVVVIPDALEKIAGLRGVSFTRNDLDDGDKVHIGLIAQEVEAVFPEVISGDNLKAVAYGNIVAPLIEAIKTLKSQNEVLSRRLDAMDARLKDA